MEDSKSFVSVPRSVEGEDVTTWSLPEGAIARLGRGRNNDMAFSPDGQYLAVGTSIGFWLYELPTLSPIALLDAARRTISAVAFSSDSHWLVTYTFVEHLKVWDVQSGACVTEIDVPDERHCSHPIFSQDGQHIAAVSDGINGKIYIWCTKTGTQLSAIEIGETYGIYPFQFSPDINLLTGRKRATDSDPESILIWHVETGEQIGCFTGYPERMDNLYFSHDGRSIAAGSSDGTIHAWDVRSGELTITDIDYGDAQIFPHYTPENELIAAAVSDHNVEVWNIGQNEKLDEFEHRGNNWIACFSENGTQLAVASPSEIQIWTKGDNADSHALSTLHGHIPTMDTLVFSEGEKTLAAGLWRDNVLFWDVASRCSYRPHGEKLPGTHHNVYLSAAGEIISTSTDKTTLKMWKVGNSEPIAEFTKPEVGLLRAEAFMAIGSRLARVDGESNIHVWECGFSSNDTSESEGWKKHITLIGHETPSNRTGFSMQHVVGLTFSRDGKRLASISRDCTAYLWDVDTGKQLAELSLTPPSSQRTYGEYDTGIAFSPRDDIIAGGKWGEIVFWDATDGRTLMALPQPEGSQRPIALCFSPCGEYLASGAWWQLGLQKVPIRLWEVATGKNIATFWGHTTDVQCFTFSQDGTLLVSGGHDGAIYLWDLTPYL